MMYCTKEMEWGDIYEISKSSKYFLADVAQYSCLEDQVFVIFDDPDEMLEWFVNQRNGHENDDGQIAKVVGYEYQGKSEVTWADENGRKQTRHMSFYIPKIEWVYKDNAQEKEQVPAKIIENMSEMYLYLMCKDNDKVITAQNSHIIHMGILNDNDNMYLGRMMTLTHYGYLLDTEEDCVNFWKAGLEGKFNLRAKLDILGEDGKVKLVDIVEQDRYGYFHYQDIDFKRLEFVRLEKIKTEICPKNFDILFRAYINVYYPVFRFKYWPT